MGERNFHLHGNSFNRRAIGTEYETLACEYLTRHGYQILCRNFRCRQVKLILSQEIETTWFLSRSNTAAMNTKAIRRRQWMPASRRGFFVPPGII